MQAPLNELSRCPAVSYRAVQGLCLPVLVTSVEADTGSFCGHEQVGTDGADTGSFCGHEQVGADGADTGSFCGHERVGADGTDTGSFCGHEPS